MPRKQLALIAAAVFVLSAGAVVYALRGTPKDPNLLYRGKIQAVENAAVGDFPGWTAKKILTLEDGSRWRIDVMPVTLQPFLVYQEVTVSKNTGPRLDGQDYQIQREGDPMGAVASHAGAKVP